MGHKVFGVGLSRTGTTSLHRAFQVLGLSSVHNPRDLGFYGDFSSVDAHDAASDVAVASRYKTLDQRYPGSKFILTLRDVDKWLESMKWLWSSFVILKKHAEDIQDKLSRTRVELFGTDRFDPEILRKAYENHTSEVRSYFQGRNDFLEMNICGGEGWDRLCRFLGKPVPESQFPRLNDRKSHAEAVAARKLLGKKGSRG